VNPQVNRHLPGKSIFSRNRGLAIRRKRWGDGSVQGVKSAAAEGERRGQMAGNRDKLTRPKSRLPTAPSFR
jgi:hypothetical protein